MSKLSERLAAFCRELASGDLRPVAADAGAADAVDQILADLRSGTPEEALGAELDRLDAALIRYGIVGGLTPTARQYQASPAASDGGHLTAEVWACPRGPQGRCGRWHAIGAATDPPACAVDDSPLVRKRPSR
ncbi:hypothetical protein [Streptomyces sp. TRM49041]|uniref:hypothetical protein n=1 Tax=Streptomyces sp. TRM49041 TaxID=2603216 RepID=UPI0011EDC902|nr:hypothetical protein [Streptomyces sp. TRM49041]